LDGQGCMVVYDRGGTGVATLHRRLRLVVFLVGRLTCLRTGFLVRFLGLLRLRFGACDLDTLPRLSLLLAAERRIRWGNMVGYLLLRGYLLTLARA